MYYDEFASVDYAQVLKVIGAYSAVFLVLSILMIVELWVIYKKCNKPGWAAIIPIYNVWVLFELGGLPGWLCLIPFANFVGLIVAYFKLPKRFNKSGIFGLGILFLPVIFLGILALSKVKEDSASEPVVENSEPQPDFYLETPEPEVANEIVQEVPVEQHVEEPVQEEVPVGSTVNEPKVLSPEEIQEISRQEQVQIITDPIDYNNNVEVLENEEVKEPTLELPKLANETINQDITETKKCPGCGYENEYSNKTCKMCGNELE